MFVNRTTYIPNWLNDMQTVITKNRTNFKQEKALQEQEEVKKESLRKAREAARFARTAVEILEILQIAINEYEKHA